jgi:hypothetical protein
MISNAFIQGVADYGYDVNFLNARKIYKHRTLGIFKMVFSYLDSATSRMISPEVLPQLQMVNSARSGKLQI